MTALRPGLLLTVAVLLGMAILVSSVRQVTYHSAPPTVPAGTTEDDTERAPQLLGADGCLLPLDRQAARLTLERPDGLSWQLAQAAAERLAEDPCGNVWALWFNHWSVFEQGDPQRARRLQIPSGPATAAISSGGVLAFLATGDALWVLGRSGTLARLSAQGWQRLPSPAQHCARAQLLRHDGDVWLSCRGSLPGFLGRYDAPTQQWISLLGDWATAPMLALSEDGRLIAAGGDRLAEYTGAANAPWRTLAAVSPASRALAIGVRQWATADERGLSLHDLDGNGRHTVADSAGVTAVRFVERGLWASLSGRGLRYFDGKHWHSWRYAHGLPDDTANDMLIDQAGRLWLAGSPLASIKAAAAAEQIVALTDPVAIPSRTYASACEAARTELGRQPQSGQIAQVLLNEHRLVFFDHRAVCMDVAPAGVHYTYRSADGAVLSVTAPSPLKSDCAADCELQIEAQDAPEWQVALHLPRGPRLDSGLQTRQLPAPPLSPEAHIAALVLSTNGQVWLATREHGVVHYDGSHWQRYAAERALDQRNPVSDLIEDDYGRIWIASRPRWEAAQSRYSAAPLLRWRGGEWTPYPSPSASPSWVAYSLTAVPEGILALGNGRLMRAQGESELSPLDAPFTLSGTAIAVDRARYLWLSHGDRGYGLSLQDGGRWGRLSSREGLFSDRIQAIAFDDRQRPWMLASDGRVAVYEREALWPRVHWYAP